MQPCTTHRTIAGPSRGRMAAAAHDASEMAGAPVPPPPVVASKAFLTPAAMWERFVKALPEGIRVRWLN